MDAGLHRPHGKRMTWRGARLRGPKLGIRPVQLLEDRMQSTGQGASPR